MASVPFDTLKLARRLQEAGFPPKQAGDTAEALAETLGKSPRSDRSASNEAEDAAMLVVRSCGGAAWRRMPRDAIQSVRHALTLRWLAILAVWGVWVWLIAYAVLAR